MQKLIFLLTLIILQALFCSSLLAREKGDWLIRIGPSLIEPNDSSNDVEGIPDSGVRVDNQLTLGYQIAYMFTKNIGLELLGVTPANHDLQGEGSIAGLGGLGDVDVFPPTLSLQYHFDNSSKFIPYIGLGINYTVFLNEDTSASLETALGGDTDLDINDSIGLSGQVGVDYFVSDSIFFNASIWYIDIDADAELTTGDISRDIDIEIDPWVFFVGIGKKF